MIRVVLFSEVNSKLGSPFLDLLARHPMVDLRAVVTSPPGRSCSYFADDVHRVDLEFQAFELGVRALRPAKVNDAEVIAALRELRPDYFIVGNFQQILKPELLAIPEITSVNFHPSPLPRYAGLAPFHWMVRHGERHGAVTALEVDAGIHTGDVIMQRETPLTGRETAVQLRTVQERANVRMLDELIPSLVDRSFTTTPQDTGSRSYFGRPAESDYLIDFEQDAETIGRVVRAGYRHPGAFAWGADGSKVVLLSVTSAYEAHQEPLAVPGTVRRTAFGVFVGTRDSWLRVVSVQQDGVEVVASRDDAVLPDGMVLTTGALV